MTGRRALRWELALVTSCVVIGVLLVMAPGYAFVLPALLLLVLAFSRPHFGALLLVISAFSVEWLTVLGVLPPLSALFQDVLALVLTGAIVLRVMSAGLPQVVRRSALWFGAFLVAALLSAIANTADPLGVLLGLRPLVRFVPLLFVPVVFGWSERQSRAVLWTIVAAVAIQVPVAVVQFLGISGRSADAVGGTLGFNTSGVLTALIIATVTLLAGMYVYRAGRRSAILGGVLALCVPPAINETKVFFVAAPAIWAVTIIPRLRRGSLSSIVLVLAIVVAIAGALQSYSAVFGNRLSTEAGWEQLWEEQTSLAPEASGVMRRVPSLLFAGDMLAESPPTLLLGFGPGSLTRSEPLDFAGVLVRSHGRLLRNPVTAVRLSLEFGALGLVCLGGLLVSLRRVGRRVERDEHEPLWRGVATGLRGTLLTVVLLSIYTSTLNADAPACVLWALGGLVAWRGQSLRALATGSTS